MIIKKTKAKTLKKLGMVAHIYNLSAKEAETGGL
jgi:hypothetical protein